MWCLAIFLLSFAYQFTAFQFDTPEPSADFRYLPTSGSPYHGFWLCFHLFLRFQSDKILAISVEDLEVRGFKPGWMDLWLFLKPLLHQTRQSQQPPTKLAQNWHTGHLISDGGPDWQCT